MSAVSTIFLAKEGVKERMLANNLDFTTESFIAETKGILIKALLAVLLLLTWHDTCQA